MNKQMYARLIALFTHAHRLANISVWLSFLAILVFVLFGTLSSMGQFRQNMLIYGLFYYLPYGLIALTVPMSLYQAFLLYRYRIVQFYILSIVLLTGFLLPLTAFVFWLMEAYVSAAMTLFLAMVAWFAMPFLFRVNLVRYLNFLKEQQNDTHA